MKNIFFILILGAYIIQGLFPVKFQFGRGINIQNIAVYLVLISLLISEIATKKINKIEIPGLFILCLGTFYVFTSIILLSFSNEFHIPIFNNIVYFKRIYFDAIIVYLIAFLLCDNQKDAYRFLSIIVIVFELLNNFNLINNILNPSQAALEYNRYTGFGNANKTAYLLCCMLPFVFYFYRSQKNLIIKMFYVGLMVMTTITVAFSGSRGGILVFCMIAISTIILFRDLKMFALIAFIVPFILLLVWNNIFFQETLSRLSQLSNESLQYASSNRISIWKSIWQVFISSPIYIFFGTGFNTSSFVGLGINPHNMYLRFLLEIGIVGLTLLICYILRTVIYIIKSPTLDTMLKKAVFTSVCVVLIAWFFTCLEGVMSFITLTTGVALSNLKFKVHQPQ